jgi:hypothetical protein
MVLDDRLVESEILKINNSAKQYSPAQNLYCVLTINFSLMLHHNRISESQSDSELLYDWRFTANQFVLAISPLGLTTSNFIFQLNLYGYSPYVTTSLKRGWVCRLQLLLVLASTVILRSHSRGTHDHIFLSQIRGSPNLEGQVPVFISPRIAWGS